MHLSYWSILPHLVIFKGKPVQQQWFPKELDRFVDWQLTATENGSDYRYTAVKWLQKVFIPSTKPKQTRRGVGFGLEGQ